MIDLHALVRENIKNLKPYLSARDEFQGQADIFLDANENALGSTIDASLNRYPDPRQRKLKNRIGKIKNIASGKIFLGNGSDEVIDLLIRAFCEPARDKIMIMPPTYGMYQVCADINNVEVLKVALTRDFKIDFKNVFDQIDEFLRLIFICSPNNPTGNLMDRSDIESILQKTKGLVVVDEAYIDFASQESLISNLSDYPNLIIMQTLSKAWGLASLRLGMAFADPFLSNVLTNIKPPYNVNGMTQKLVLQALQDTRRQKQMVQEIIDQREFLELELKCIPFVEKIHPSDANFLLVRFTDAPAIFRHLMSSGIIVRDRSKAFNCENCLRITVGTQQENFKLIDTLKTWK